MHTFYCFIQTACGRAMLTSDGRALTGLYFEGQKDEPAIEADWRHDEDAAPFAAAREQLAAYEHGRLTRFSLPLALHGTPFQRRVWDALQGVAHGQTISYAQLAARIGAPAAVRAVGAAVGRNPISVIVPCHRIVGSDGSLTGYAGGLERKRSLLEREGCLPAAASRAARRGRAAPAATGGRA